MQQRVYNSLEEVQDEILAKNPSSILLVHGRNSFEASGAKKRLKKLLSRNITRFYDFSPNPEIEEVFRGIRLCKQINPEFIIAVGGGSVIDMAKLIKGLTKSKDILSSIKGLTSADPLISKLIAVPTTAGSGSESTPFAVVYINKKKYSLQHEDLLPEEIVLDWTLTQSLPKKQTASTGMDALSQAIESYWSINSIEESKIYSKESIKIVLENLENAVNFPDEKSRKSMMKAANLAGKAIAIAKTTACHSISYPITSRFGIPHGHAVVLSLGEVLEYNSEVNEKDCLDARGKEYVRKTIKEISEILDAKSIKEAKEKIKELMKSIGLETKLSDLNISDIELIVREGFNPERMKNNPRKIEENDLRNILEKIR